MTELIRFKTLMNRTVFNQIFFLPFIPLFYVHLNKTLQTDTALIFIYFFVSSCGMNGSDEHARSKSSQSLRSSLTAQRRCRKKNGSSPGTNRQQPGAADNPSDCAGICSLEDETQHAEFFPFSLTSLLTLCLFSFSFKIVLEKEGEKNENEIFKEQMTKMRACI